MKKTKLLILTMTCLALLVVSCGQGATATGSTKLMDIGEGLSYKPYSDVQVHSTSGTENSTNTPPTAENIEGLREVMIELAENSVVRSKPQSNSPVIGSLDEGSEVGVYGETEDGKWSIINYNGRIGYLLTENLIRRREQQSSQGAETGTARPGNEVNSTPVINSTPIIDATPDLTPNPTTPDPTPDPEPITPIDPEEEAPLEPITPVDPEIPLPEGS